jgi:hypothetical protein
MIGYIYIPWTQRLKQSKCLSYERPFEQPGIPDVNSIQRSGGNWQIWPPDQIEEHASEFVDASIYEGMQTPNPCSATASEPDAGMQRLNASSTVRILAYQLFTVPPRGPRASQLIFALVDVTGD